jgi:hypothetical protein
MAVLHMKEAELFRNIASVMDRVESGEEIIIERNAKRWQCCGQPNRAGANCPKLWPENSAATLNAGFAADVRSFIDSHREPLNPPECIL